MKPPAAKLPVDGFGANSVAVAVGRVLSIVEPGLERPFVDDVLTRGAPGQNNGQRQKGPQERQTHTGVHFP